MHPNDLEQLKDLATRAAIADVHIEWYDPAASAYKKSIELAKEAWQNFDNKVDDLKREIIDINQNTIQLENDNFELTKSLCQMCFGESI